MCYAPKCLRRSTSYSSIRWLARSRRPRRRSQQADCWRQLPKKVDLTFNRHSGGRVGIRKVNKCFKSSVTMDLLVLFLIPHSFVSTIARTSWSKQAKRFSFISPYLITFPPYVFLILRYRAPNKPRLVFFYLCSGVEYYVVCSCYSFLYLIENKPNTCIVFYLSITFQKPIKM